jgi:hypothetical protein
MISSIQVRISNQTACVHGIQYSEPSILKKKNLFLIGSSSNLKEFWEHAAPCNHIL